MGMWVWIHEGMDPCGVLNPSIYIIIVSQPFLSGCPPSSYDILEVQHPYISSATTERSGGRMLVFGILRPLNALNPAVVPDLVIDNRLIRLPC